MSKRNVVIVGAGICGLYAAKRLLSSGIGVAIVEARKRTGGRIWTHYTEFQRPVELGAEFLHGRPKLSLKMMDEAGESKVKAGGKFLELRDDGVRAPKFESTDWYRLLNEIKKLDADITFRKFFDDHFSANTHAEFRDSVFRLIEGYDAAAPDKISAFALRDEWQQDDTQHRIRNYYGSIIQHLEKEINKLGGKIFLEHTVDHITWNEREVNIHTTQKKLQANKVLVTVPISILQQEKIKFTPSIHDYIEASRKIGFGDVIKMIFEFKAPFWKTSKAREDLKDFDFVLTDAKVPTWWTQTSENSTLLTGWIAGPVVNQLSNETLYDDAMNSLSYIFKMTRLEIESLLQCYKIANWRDDLFSLGAYAYATPLSLAARKILTTPVVNRIYFAGEALNENAAMGTVEAALQSAEAMVRKMIG
ncbi:MAG TPA: NAD(P)/FAD-dependent oxidoreductase [Chryseosolibacter sp.]|nr:NAD(P)/FAD-dependent oxidoreductase [Chryseosolibacter sp.]